MPVECVGNTQRPGRPCCVCGAAVSPDHIRADAQGNCFCENCYRGLADDQVPPDDSSAFRCAVCAQSFPVDGVYDQDGIIICKRCFAGQAEPVPLAASTPPPFQSPASPRAQATQKSPRPAAAPVPMRRPPALLARVTCPHCWHRFAPEQILWVAQHSDLIGDQVLGPEAPARFLPSRFTLESNALDARGMTCHLLACPRCHLIIPRSLLETDPLFVSIVGVPSSGKSNFLTAMTWELRRLLPRRFAVAFNDADTITNRSLNEYEEVLFLQSNRDQLVTIHKTQTQGDLYDQVRLGQHILSLPRPFLFSFRPIAHHPAASDVDCFTRLMCLYDNAGEHFQPGMDSSASPVTQHLARSRVLMFLYDPTQDPRLRELCRERSNDPQLDNTARTQRQEIILTEAALRIRRYTGLGTNQKHGAPLLVIVPKSDIWGFLIDADIVSEPLVLGAADNGRLAAVDVPRIEAVSARIRDLLMRHAPEFVAAAEEFSQYVIYIPVSALGHAPEMNEKRELGIRPRDINPHWVTVPVLYSFSKWASGLVAAMQPEWITPPEE